MFSFKLTPRNDLFFSILERASAQAVEAARLLCDLLNDYTEVPAKVAKLTEAEKKADEINHEMVRHLNKIFITPFDRDDLHRLAFAIDDIVDALEAAGITMQLCKVQAPTSYAIKMAALVLNATASLNALMPNLREMRDGQSQYITIHELENQGDELWQQAFASLFTEGANPLDVIKWKEIYENIEQALDATERVAEIVEEVIQKNG